MRQFVRHPTDIPICVRAEALRAEDLGDCQMTTVSQGGLSCQVDRPFIEGTIVSIDIPSVTPPYHGLGEVVWCLRRGERYELGVRFTDSEEAYKSRMVQQVCQIEHYKNLVFEREGRILDGNQAASEWIEKYAAYFE